MSDIVEMLRRGADRLREVELHTHAVRYEKAADEIERLRAQNARLMARGIEDMRNEIERLRERLAAAEEVCSWFDENEGEDRWPDGTQARYRAEYLRWHELAGS